MFRIDKTVKIKMAKIPVLGRLVLMLLRLKGALGYCLPSLLRIIPWLFKSKEVANYTYNLTDTNKCYLTALIAHITGRNYDEITGYIREIQENDGLKQHIVTQTKKSEMSFWADSEARYGRRIGWYAFVRALKPKVVVETGVDNGLGSCLLTTALMMNKKEGFEGYYYGTDKNPQAGWLLTSDLKRFGHVLYGDSIESLRKLNEIVDIFINDSDHSAGYEENEYITISPKLSSNAIILGDNAHVTDKLLRFSLNTGRNFLFFQEKPLNHWYPGAGIGIAFKRE